MFKSLNDCGELSAIRVFKPFDGEAMELALFAAMVAIILYLELTGTVWKDVGC